MKLTGSLFCGNLRQGLLSRRFPLAAAATALLLWLPFIPATGEIGRASCRERV